jgi:hypothetical protein
MTNLRGSTRLPVDLCNCDAAPAFLSRRPDADKNEEEVRRELGQLREAWHADQLELTKLHQVR